VCDFFFDGAYLIIAKLYSFSTMHCCKILIVYCFFFPSKNMDRFAKWGELMIFFWRWLLSHESIFFVCHWFFCVLVFYYVSLVFCCHRLMLFSEGACQIFLFFLLPQVNGHPCVSFGCTHPIDGLFWSLPIYLLDLFSKYECWVIDLFMLSYIIFFGVVTCLFVLIGFISLWNVKTNSYD
jgi:hypothetical protein